MGEKPDRITGGEPLDDMPGPEDVLDPTVGSFDTSGVYVSEVEGVAYDTPEVYADQGMPVDTLDDSDTGDGDIDQSRTQIEQTRSAMSETIDAIQQKLSPQNLAQQAKDSVKDATVGRAQAMASEAGDTAKGIGSTIIETIKENPVPAALAGIGIGWLFMSGRKSGTTPDYSSRYGSGSQYGYGRSYSGTQSGTPLSDRVSQAQDAAGTMASQAQDMASSMASQAQDTAGQVANQVQNTAGQFVDTAQSGAQQAGSTFQQMVRDNPLGVGMMAVAVGAAIGLSIPETDKENQLMGPAKDGVVQQAQQTVQEKAQQVQSAAQQAVGIVQDATNQ